MQTPIQPAIPRLTRIGRDWTCLLLLAWLASACVTWSPHPLDIAASDAGRLQGPVRVVVRDGSGFEMNDVQISADSVTGSRAGPVSERVAIPRSQVISVERRAFSAGRTAILLLGLAGGAVVLFYLYWLSIDISGT